MQLPRAARDIVNAIRYRRPLFWWPRPGYCVRCGTWAWLTNERPAYSAYDGAFLCEDCAELNDEETRYAWAEYYGGLL